MKSSGQLKAAASVVVFGSLSFLSFGVAQPNFSLFHSDKVVFVEINEQANTHAEDPAIQRGFAELHARQLDQQRRMGDRKW